MTNDEQRTIRDEQTAVNNGEQTSNTDEQVRTDGGGTRCVRCASGPRTAQIGAFPASGGDGGVSDLCLECFAERLSSNTPLTNVEAKILGAEHLGHKPATIVKMTTYPKMRIHELRASAADKITDARDGSAVRAATAALDVRLPATGPE